jgi:hypothetical protein
MTYVGKEGELVLPRSSCIIIDRIFCYFLALHDNVIFLIQKYFCQDDVGL